MKLLGMMILCAAAGAQTKTAPRTFTKDVAPILQARCQSCHRPGEAAPMSLLTYKETRPWAKAIKEAVLTKKMPPWFADPSAGHFRNDRSLTAEETARLVSWVDTGAQEGDARDLPAPKSFVEGWNIGQPDLVLEMPQAFDVPSSGTIEYQYVVLPYKFTEERWVQMAEVRPGARSVVHHVIAFIREPGSKWERDRKPGEVFVPELNKDGKRPSISGDILSGFAPGTPPSIIQPGQGRLIKAGSDIVLQLHYTTNKKAAADKTRVGITFCKTPPAQRVMTLAASNNKFTIPPGDPNYRVDAQFELGHEARLTSLDPHMHLRGKDFEYRLTYPTGETQTILRVPHYDFGWQLWYEPTEDIVLPKGTIVACTAHFDNSPNNPFNPDPTKAVKWGDQSWEEMMIGFFDVVFDAGMDPELLRVKKQPARTGE